MDREVYLLSTHQGYVAHQGTLSYTSDPDLAISFVDVDVASEKARELYRFSGVVCEPRLHRQQFPRPLPPTSHGTQVSEVSPRSST